MRPSFSDGKPLPRIDEESRGWFEGLARHELWLQLSVQTNALLLLGAEQQRLAPIPELRDVGGKSDHRRCESIDSLCKHRVARKRVFDFDARFDDAFDDAFERVVAGDDSQHKLGFGLGWNDVTRHASFDHPDVHRRSTESPVVRKLDPAKIAENIEQLLDRGLPHFRIGGMRGATPRPENGPQSPFRPKRQL